jgi:hypothetical protein
MADDVRRTDLGRRAAVSASTVRWTTSTPVRTCGNARGAPRPNAMRGGREARVLGGPRDRCRLRVTAVLRSGPSKMRVGAAGISASGLRAVGADADAPMVRPSGWDTWCRWSAAWKTPTKPAIATTSASARASGRRRTTTSASRASAPAARASGGGAAWWGRTGPYGGHRLGTRARGDGRRVPRVRRDGAGQGGKQGAPRTRQRPARTAGSRARSYPPSRATDKTVRGVTPFERPW